jgi:hypothetical protein
VPGGVPRRPHKRPPVWQLVTSNLYTHRERKEQDEDDIMICQCKKIWATDTATVGCGPECLNRMLNIECVEVRPPAQPQQVAQLCPAPCPACVGCTGLSRAAWGGTAVHTDAWAAASAARFSYALAGPAALLYRCAAGVLPQRLSLLQSDVHAEAVREAGSGAYRGVARPCLPGVRLSSGFSSALVLCACALQLSQQPVA